MLIAKNLIDRIDEIVERSYIGFTHDLIGDDFFSEEQKRTLEGLGLIVGRKPLIELLYVLVRQRSTPGYKKDASLQMLLDDVTRSGILPAVRDTEAYTIEHAKHEVKEAVETSKSDLKKKVKQEITQVNNEYKNEIATERIDTIPNLAEKNTKFSNLLLAGVAGLLVATQTNFVRSFTTSITNLANHAAVDELVGQVTIDGGSPADVRVYKEVINDSSLCQWCQDFYMSADGSPIVYKLSELQRNGSNFGKPKSAWLPTVDAVHPRCRCQLHYISDSSS